MEKIGVYDATFYRSFLELLDKANTAEDSGSADLAGISMPSVNQL